MIAKRDYYNKLFNKYSKNLKITWKAINDTLNRHKTKVDSQKHLSYLMEK